MQQKSPYPIVLASHPVLRFFELGPADGLDGADRLPGDTFQFQDGATPRLIRIWAEKEQQNLLGTAVSSFDNGQTIWLRNSLKLNNFDTPQVWITALDRAGNESSPVAVRTTWFVGSTADSRSQSPHEISESPVAVSPLQPQIRLAAQQSINGIDSNAHTYSLIIAGKIEVFEIIQTLVKVPPWLMIVFAPKQYYLGAFTLEHLAHRELMVIRGNGMEDNG